MIIIDCEQYEPEWWSARLGVPTASQFSNIVDTKGNPSKSAEKYRNRLATEKITGVPTETYQNAAMERGHEMEAHARTLFEFKHDVDVKQVGLIFRDEQRKYAASPDGLLPDTGLEIFCPEAPNMVDCLLNPEKSLANAKKFQQIQGSMLVTGFETWNFAVYYPGMPTLFQVIKRDDAFCEKLEKELNSFVEKLAITVTKLRKLAE